MNTEINNIDENIFDVESIEIDAQNNNFEIENLEDYRYTNIVRVSIENGQLKQAREQAQKFGLDYAVIFDSRSLEEN